jgi:hypothetical protein
MDKKTILTDENREQVQAIVTKAMANLKVVRFTEDELRTLRADVDRHEAILRDAQRERKRYDQELKEIGFHDVGHARTELSSQIK